MSHDPLDSTTWWDPSHPDRVHKVVASRPSLLGTCAVGLLVRHYSVRTDWAEHVAGRPRPHSTTWSFDGACRTAGILETLVEDRRLVA